MNAQLMKQNTELQGVNTELQGVNTELQEVIKQNNVIMKETLDTVKNAKGNTINNNISINFFLNDKCKDAMNIADFIDTLKISMGDLDNFGKGGFIEGVSNVIIKRLNELEVEERPIHCTDVKRKSLYLKDKDTWNKEDAEMNNMKKMIDTVRHKNMMKLPEWQEENCLVRFFHAEKP